MIGEIFVAWWGAILGTLGTGLSIWNYWRDQPRIKVSVEKDMELLEHNMTSNPKEKFIMVIAANTGRHPVHLCKAYFTLRSSTKKMQVCGPSNCCIEILNPGLHRAFPAIQSQCDLGDLKEVYVVDAIDRKFKCKLPRSWQKKEL